MAKKLTQEDLVLNIIVNSNRAQTEIGKLSRGLVDAKSKLKDAENEMKKLDRQGKTNSSRYQQLQKDVIQYNATISESKRRLGELNQTLGLQDKSLKQLETSLRRTRQLWRQATNDRDRQRYANEINQLNRRIRELNQGTQQTGGALAGLARGVGAYIAGIASVTAGIRKSFETNLQMERVNQSLLEASGSSENFERNLEFLRETTERLGLEFFSTADAFKLWQGAARFSNLTAQESRDIFESVANAGAKMKLSNEQIEGTFLALSQMMSKGKVQAEELRGQLAERLPGAFAIAAESMGVTEQQLNKMLEQGEVIADEFLPRFAAQLDKTFGNDKNEKIEGQQAALNRLTNEWNSLFESNRVSKFFTVVLDGFARMFKEINLMINSKSWAEFKAIAFGGLDKHAEFVRNRDLTAGQRSVPIDFAKKTKKEREILITETKKLLDEQAKLYKEQGHAGNMYDLKYYSDRLAYMYQLHSGAGGFEAVRKPRQVGPDAADLRKQQAAEKAAKREAERLAKQEKQLQESIEKQIDMWKHLYAERGENEDKELLELEKRYAEFLKLTENNEEKRTEVASIYTELRLKRLREIDQANAKALLDQQKSEADIRYQQQLAEYDREYAAQVQAITQSNATAEEKELALTNLLKHAQEQRRQLEEQAAIERMVLLDAAISSGNLEIEEAKRVADEKKKIQEDLLQKQVEYALEEQRRRLEIENKTNEALFDIKQETVKAYEAAYGLMGDFFEENSAMAKMFLALEKGAAAAHVIINLQKEMAGYLASTATLGPAGPILAAKLITAAKIRAGISLATIAATTIKGLAASPEKGNAEVGNKSPRHLRGREQGGYLDVTREQDGKLFRAKNSPSMRGYVSNPTVIVGESGKEWVANNDMVTNPFTAPIIAWLDTVQRQGQINPAMLSQISRSAVTGTRVSGRQSGGRISDDTTNTFAPNDPGLINVLNRFNDTVSKLENRLSNIRAEVSLLGKNGFVEKMDELNKIQNQSTL